MAYKLTPNPYGPDASATAPIQPLASQNAPPQPSYSPLGGGSANTGVQLGAPPPAPSADDIMLQHLSQMPGGGDATAGLATASGVRQFASDVAANQPPDLSREQSYYDWFTRHYQPSALDTAKLFGHGAAYGLEAAPSMIAEATGHPLPVSAQDIRQSVEQARRAAGPYDPFIEAAGTMANPATWAGWGLPAVGTFASRAGAPLTEAAVKYLPEAASKYLPDWLLPRAFSGGAQASTLSAANTIGAGGSPSDILQSALTAFPEGGALSTLVPATKGVTPADVTASTAARNKALQEQLTKLYGQAGTNAQAQAQATAETLKTTPVGKEGFSIAGNNNPSVADALEHQKWLETVKPSDPGGEAVPDMQKHVDQALNAPEIKPLIEQHQAATANAARYAANPNPLPADLLGDQEWLKDFPSAGPTVAAAAKAAQQAQFAPTMERWLYKEGMSDTDPRGEAAQAIVGKDKTPGPGQFQIGSPEADALRNIATVQTPPDARPLPSWMRRVLTSGLAGIGEYGGQRLGWPGWGGGSGATVGGGIADVADWWRRPQGVSPLIEQQVKKGYQPMTGQALSSGNDDAFRALMLLNQARRQ